MASKFDTNIHNNWVGPYITTSAPIAALDQSFPRPALYLKATVAGGIVYANDLSGDIGFANFEAGEMIQIACTKVLTSGTVYGVSQTTTVPEENIWWFSCGSYPFRDASKR